MARFFDVLNNEPEVVATFALAAAFFLTVFNINVSEWRRRAALTPAQRRAEDERLDDEG